MLDFTTDPVEAEVSTALAGYKLALIRTGYKGVSHRILCWFGDKEATARAVSLERAEQNARTVANQSPEHRAMLDKIIQSQPVEIAERDNFLSLLRGTIES